MGSLRISAARLLPGTCNSSGEELGMGGKLVYIHPPVLIVAGWNPRHPPTKNEHTLGDVLRQPIWRPIIDGNQRYISPICLSEKRPGASHS
jgi:hypothetical protein